MLTSDARRLLIHSYIPENPKGGWLTPNGVAELVRLSLLEKEEQNKLTEVEHNIQDNFLEAKQFVFQEMVKGDGKDEQRN